MPSLGHLLSQKPRVAVMVHEASTDELVAALSSHELDCVIGRSFHGDTYMDVTQEAIYQETASILVHAASQARLSKDPVPDWGRLAALDWILPPSHTPLRRTLNAIFLSAGVQPPLPLVETLSLKNMATVLAREPNSVTILAHDVAAEIAATGVAKILPYRLSWSMPPISLFVPQAIARQPTVKALAAAIRKAAADLGGNEVS